MIKQHGRLAHVQELSDTKLTKRKTSSASLVM